MLRGSTVSILSELDEIIAAAIRPPMEQTSVDNVVARDAGESSPIDPEDRDWKLRQGVYRVVIVSPRYEPKVLYVQLTNDGLIETRSPDSEAGTKPMPNDWRILLHRRSKEAKTPIAVWPFVVTAATQPGKEFTGEAKRLEDAFLNRLNENGHIAAFMKSKREIVMYDSGRAKGQEPQYPDADVAEFQVKAFPTFGPSPVTVSSAH